MLSIPWQQRKPNYKFLIVGSGYGGSIMAARLSAALKQPHSICILERGKEWAVGTFPSLPEFFEHAVMQILWVFMSF
jgi:cholesterol oxidase